MTTHKEMTLPESVTLYKVDIPNVGTMLTFAEPINPDCTFIMGEYTRHPKPMVQAEATLREDKGGVPAIYIPQDQIGRTHGTWSKYKRKMDNAGREQSNSKPRIALYQSANVIDGDTSDGYHTFNELYEHRHTLFAALLKCYPEIAWKSLKHADGTMFDGWFIAGLNTPSGQATYHIPMRLWYSFEANVLHEAPEWDGHTADDVIKRIAALKNPSDAGGEE